jgi:hypothetical protein
MKTNARSNSPNAKQALIRARWLGCYDLAFAELPPKKESW